MRRRPSGSGEDEAGKSDTSKRKDRSKDMSAAKEKPGGSNQSLKPPPDRRTSREKRRTSLQQERPAWAQTTPNGNHAPEKTRDAAQLPSKGDYDGGVEKRRRHPLSAQSPWKCSLLTLATSACAMLVLLSIVYSFLSRQLDPKGCAMSYMRPIFYRFPDFDTEHTRFASKYSLYLYREGGVDEDTRVKGVPILFIPGNAGSYKQMRPIAAEAANYFHNELREDTASINNGKRPLDFFTVDFNEELTAFHGQTLLDQAEYLNEAIAYILALYHNPQASVRESGLPDPKSVILLGHSMGGMVARSMLHMSNYQEDSINTIITLATPHSRAPVSFDVDMVSTYQDMNSYWRESYSLEPENNPLADVTLVSVAGGGLDTMIASEYTSLTSIVPDTHGFTVFTSGIPHVWTGMDHLAIMWCDQLRKAIVKAIFDVVDVRRPAQTRAQSERITALRRRLLTGMESVVEKVAPKRELSIGLTLPQSMTTVLPEGTRLDLRSISVNDLDQAYVMPVPTKPHRDGGKLTVLTDQVLSQGDDDGNVSVFLCGSTSNQSYASSPSAETNSDFPESLSESMRLNCRNAVVDVSPLPASTSESVNAFDSPQSFSYLQYDTADLIDINFLVVVQKATEATPGWLVAEFISAEESSISISGGHHQLLVQGVQRELPADRPMMTEVVIPEVQSTLFAYTLEIDRPQCQRDESFAPLLRQHIQEPYESKYFVNTRGGNLNVHGLSPYMPPPLRGDTMEGLSLQIWTDPACNTTMTISLKVDILGSVGKLVMRYRTVFASFPVLVIAVVLRKQFKIYDSTGVFISFSQSTSECLRTSLPTIFTALTFLAVALSKAARGSWANILLSTSDAAGKIGVDFASNDLLLGTSDPFFWFLVPLFGLISIGICITVNYVVLALTHIFAITISQIRAWTVGAAVASRPPSSFVISSPQQRLFIIGVLLLLVSTVVPYQFAYLVLCLVQLTTTIRALSVARDTQLSNNHNFYNYTHAMLVIMLWILPINLPVLTVWIHNLAVHWFSPFSSHHNLLSIVPYILIVETMSTGSMVPRITGRIRFLTNILTFLLALYAAIYGVSYAYRLHYIVNALCAWLSVIHFSAGPLSLARLARGAGTEKSP